MKKSFVAMFAAVALMAALPAHAKVSAGLQRAALTTFAQENGYTLIWQLAEDISLTPREAAAINRKLGSASTALDAIEVIVTSVGDDMVQAEVYANNVIVLREKNTKPRPQINGSVTSYTLTVSGKKIPALDEEILSQVSYLTKDQCADFVRSAILSKDFEAANKVFNFVRASCSVVNHNATH